jgi:type IV secretory pathway VirB10-like protein
MPINTTSYFAGVATAFAAVALGFAGGFGVSNPTQKVEPPNRVERVAANAPLANPQGVQAAAPVAKPDTAPPVPPAAAPEPAAPQPVAEQQPPAQQQAAQQPAAAPAPAPVVAKDDAAEPAKIREADLKAAERKRAQHRRWAERQRHLQELDAATAQVRQVDRGEGELVVQRSPIEVPRLGFFGNND